jgi:hypothetical protein
LEQLYHDTRVKPYLDYDGKLPSRPDPEWFVDKLRQVQADARSIFRLAEDHPLAIAECHRDLPNPSDPQQAFKVSYRVFIPGVVSTPKQLKPYVTAAGAPWDGSVYPDKPTAGGAKGGRLMRMLGCVKDPKGADKAVLVPVGEQRPFHDFVIQYLDGTEVELAPFPTPFAVESPIRSPPRQRQRTDRFPQEDQENIDPNTCELPATLLQHFWPFVANPSQPTYFGKPKP